MMFGQIDKSRLRSISGVRKGFDALLIPLDLKLSNEEKRMKTGLLDHAVGITSESASSYNFRTFEKDVLEQDLVLMAPRKVTAYVPVAVKPEKEKKKRVSTGAPRNVRPRVSRAQEAVQDAFFVNESAPATGSGVQGALARKMARQGGGGGGMEGPAEAVFTSTDVRLPKNFYDVINRLFSKFWSMEFDEPSVNQAFFAKIDRANCKDYGLSTFAESPMCLSVIRDRVEASHQIEILGGWESAAMTGTKEARSALTHAFKSPEDFYSDLMAMFNNISTYFPQESLAFVKGQELQGVFVGDWAEAKKTFTWK
jgi:hypothetical protein